MTISVSSPALRAPYGLLAAVLLAPTLALAQQGPQNQRERFEHALDRIHHVIVVYQENWSFDSLYGRFPGANGFQNAAPTIPQLDLTGNPILTLPQPLNGGPDPRFPPLSGQPALPVRPYDITRFVQANETTGDIIHRFYHEQLQIDHGTMDRFVAWSDNGGLVFSYFDATSMPEGLLAQEFVLCDNFFHSAFGGSFLNHHFLIAAAAPQWPNAPANAISDPDPAHLNDARVTPDGFAINTAYTINSPHPASVTDPAQLVPEQTNPTIGDRLNGHGVSWKWYSGGWDNAIAGNPDPLFQFHHQPFAYYQNYRDGTPERAAHLQDETQFFADVANHHLPEVSFIKPLGPDNEHPGYASLQQGQLHVASIVNTVRTSPYWEHTLIIVTYDENGGRWDHVPPPVIDRWGPGTRVPAILIGPMVKRGFVDHTEYETVSILSLIERKWDLRALSSRDANANPLMNAFDLHGEGNGRH
jgi:phospholipase C